MADTRNPRPLTPTDDNREHPNPAPAQSLTESLGGVVDDLRQLYTDFGLRPYRVFSVVYRWTGGVVGRGRALVISEQEFLPTPQLKETSGVRSETRTGGLVERGDVRLEEVSPRYTEDQIRVLFHSLPLPPGDQGFLEVRVDARDGATERRRFVVTGMPYRKADGFEWRANLLRQDMQRDRDGLPPVIDR